jgi:hypothetical protein
MLEKQLEEKQLTGPETIHTARKNPPVPHTPAVLAILLSPTSIIPICLLQKGGIIEPKHVYFMFFHCT